MWSGRWRGRPGARYERASAPPWLRSRLNAQRKITVAGFVRRPVNPRRGAERYGHPQESEEQKERQGCRCGLPPDRRCRHFALFALMIDGQGEPLPQCHNLQHEEEDAVMAMVTSAIPAARRPREQVRSGSVRRLALPAVLRAIECGAAEMRNREEKQSVSGSMRTLAGFRTAGSRQGYGGGFGVIGNPDCRQGRERCR